MNLYTYTIHRKDRVNFTQDIAADNQQDADRQLTIWVEKMHFDEPITTSVVAEPLPDAIAFYQEGLAEYDGEGDPICGDWQKWKLLSRQQLRCLHVEQTEEGKRIEFDRYAYENPDKFLHSLSSHRYPDREHEVSVDRYTQTLDQWASWLHEQVNLQLARAFNDRSYLGAHKAWWKLITPEALIILITEQDGITHRIHVAPHSPEDEDYGYQFQLDRVDQADEITRDAFRNHLDEFIAFFKR